MNLTQSSHIQLKIMGQKHFPEVKKFKRTVDCAKSLFTEKICAINNLHLCFLKFNVAMWVTISIFQNKYEGVTY